MDGEDGQALPPHGAGTNRGASSTARTVEFETSEGGGASSVGLALPNDGEDQRKLPSAAFSVAAQPRPCSYLPARPFLDEIKIVLITR